MGVVHNPDRTFTSTIGSRDRVPHAVFCDGGTQWVVLSAATAQNRMGNASLAPKRRVPHAPTAIGGIADGVRRSTADTLERG